MEGDDPDKPARKVWKIVRPKKFKIADEDTLNRILNPPPRFPVPEFKGLEYIHGPETESPFLFMCNEPGCEAKFTTDLHLTLHSKKHCSPENKCHFCGLLFRTEDDLQNHSSEFHPNLDLTPDANPLQCKKCGKTSRDKKALWRHVRESHRTMKYPCSQCNYEFTRPENLKAHMLTQHPSEGLETKHTCKICGVTYRHKNSLRLHLRKRHRGSVEQSYRCVICSTIYYDKQCYRNHMKRHENPVYLPCHVCNAKYRNSNHLKRHEKSKAHAEMVKKMKRKKSKSSDDLFPVPVIKTVKTENPSLTKEELTELCKKTVVKIILHRVDQEIASRSIAKVSRRKRKIKSVPDRPERKRQRKNLKDLPEKEETTTEDKYLNCIYCEKELPNLESVKSHEEFCYMKMRNSKLHICSICNKEFDKPYKLTLHLRTHTEDRPFKCSFCDSYFKSDYTKTKHEKYAHFDIRGKPYIRVYKCTHEGCSREFTNNTSLKEHLIIHSGIKFTCEKCGRLFTREQSLKKHLSHVHAECPILLECKPCNRTYKDKATYLAHLRRKRHFRKTKEYNGRQSRKGLKLRRKKQVSDDAGEIVIENYANIIGCETEPKVENLPKHEPEETGGMHLDLNLDQTEENCCLLES